LLLINFLLFLKKVLLVVFDYLVYRPLRWLLRLLFYKVAVRIYSWYFFVVKKLGWQRAKESPIMLLIKQKFIHILVIGMTILLLGINLSGKTNAADVVNYPAKTILADLVSSEFDSVDQASTDQQLTVETMNQNETVPAAEQSYTDNTGTLRAQPQAEMNSAEEEEAMQTIQNGASLVKPNIATTRITKRPRTENITYSVQIGDTISTIAENFEVSVNTILWENGLTAFSLIRPGDNLRIPPQTGITHEVARNETLASIAQKYSIDINQILSANSLSVGTKLTIGSKIFIPNGKKIIIIPRAITSTPANSYTGLSVITNIIKGPSAGPVSGNKMHWPAGVRAITQYFSWRHPAVDIAGPIGTPIYAADAGTIDFEGWGTGYGNEIVIDHGGGKKTRYGHMSKFIAKKGEEVSKGQVIGLMGSTGWSTGPHVHFEVMINGGKYNPLNYIR
jgi:murein DD-endopeptidase MepM/ murein hydrolase activator NlpD